jgi:LacI family transcriptional regulator, repressor for deo operon, udp, cdd, tsx, nupC, and nupG
MRKNKRPSIQDVAKTAGVSASTVSRVLNQKDGDIKISAKTSEKVLEAVEILGYQRNPFAFAARAQRTGIIGAVLRNIGGTSNGLLARRLQFAARERQLEVLIGVPHLASNAIERQLNIFQTELFDGLLFLGEIPSAQHTIATLQRMNKPYVFVGSHDLSNKPLVTIDLVRGTEMALDHLRELGHTKIGFLGSPSPSWMASHLRLTIMQQYLARHNLPLPDAYITDIDHMRYTPEDSDFSYRSHNTALKHAHYLLQLDDPPTAIVCANDGFAIAAVKAAWQAGLRVPTDVSIIGFGADRPGYTAYPELTMVQRPYDRLLEASLDLLEQLIAASSDDLLTTHIAFEPELVIRESTAPPHRPTRLPPT